MPAGEVSHRPPGRLEGPCSPRHEALLAGAWKDLASLHRAALIRDHRRPRTASAWRPRALARRAALRWFGSFDSLCRRTPGGRGSQKWLRGPLPFGRGTASGTSSVATAARRAAARRCWRWWFEVGIVQSSVDESRASAGRGCHNCVANGKYISLIPRTLSFSHPSFGVPVLFIYLYRVGVQSEPGCSSPFYLATYLLSLTDTGSTQERRI